MSAIKRAITRFEKAAVDKAFEETIPYDREEAIEVRQYINDEYARSRQYLEQLIERYIT